MTPSIKLIRDTMQQAIEAIDRADRCSSFLSGYGDKQSRQVIKENNEIAAKAIAEVADAINASVRNNDSTHSVITAPTLERHATT